MPHIQGYPPGSNHFGQRENIQNPFEAMPILAQPELYNIFINLKYPNKYIV